MSRPLRILVVDDQPDAVRLIEMLLTERGHQVRGAVDGPAAIDAVRDFAPDLVFCDIGLPGMDGFEVARRLRAEHGDATPTLVALTGYGHQEAIQEAIDAGFDHHVVKPSGLDDLEAMLDRFTGAVA